MYKTTIRNLHYPHRSKDYKRINVKCMLYLILYNVLSFLITLT